MKYINQPFPRFVAVGILNTGLGYILYLVVLLVLPYNLAYTISYIIGIFIAYYLNSLLVFRQPLSARKALQYPLVYVVQYLLGIMLLGKLVQGLSLPAWIGPLIVVMVTLPVTFIISRIIIKR
jgi:putative flippase GtrA